MKELIGTGTALVTPFKSDYSIDFDALGKIVEHQISNGTNYLVVLGTTGESATLSKPEQLSAIQCIQEANKQRLPLVLGIGGNNTSAVEETFSNSDLAGFCAVLSVSPYYNKPNQEGIYQHYKRLNSVSKLPIIIYNVPGRTGSNMSAETQLRLSELSNIIATKEASGNMEQVMTILAKKPDDFLVISGDDALTLPILACGGSGVISVINHAYPKTFTRMVQAALSGDLNTARQLQHCHFCRW
jgi:4-hydroxy-tetrahydrodipicolinate synthase